MVSAFSTKHVEARARCAILSKLLDKNINWEEIKTDIFWGVTEARSLQEDYAGYEISRHDSVSGQTELIDFCVSDFLVSDQIYKFSSYLFKTYVNDMRIGVYKNDDSYLLVVEQAKGWSALSGYDTLTVSFETCGDSIVHYVAGLFCNNESDIFDNSPRALLDVIDGLKK